MSVRSPFLLVVSLALLASSAYIWVGIARDGDGPRSALAESEVGDRVDFQGPLAPFVPAFAHPTAWAPVLKTLDNVTYVFLQEDLGLTVLVTAPDAVSLAGDVIVTGTVVVAQPHPDGGDVRLVIVHADRLRAVPLVG